MIIAFLVRTLFTTCFYLMVGLVKADSGKILFANRDVTDLPMYKRARLGLGYLSQEPSIFRKMTVEDNILSILETLNLKKSERMERLKHLLDGLDCPNHQSIGR